jgi:phosphate transport system substrate-binding protein
MARPRQHLPRQGHQWNDPGIVALNSGVQLPDSKITVVHRSDGSGTTFNFVNFLSKVSPEWQTTVGEGTAVKWPTGIGGKGNEGVAAYVKQIKGGIGYVELSYALQNKMTYSRMKNAAGNFVLPRMKLSRPPQPMPTGPTPRISTW